MKTIHHILCIGAALNDLLLLEEDQFVNDLGQEKGGMTLVDIDDIHAAIARTKGDVEAAPGGSACNTAVGLARLGTPVSFLGKRGDDAPGKSTQAQLEAWGLQCSMRVAAEPTGQVLSVITPDAQRTMMTCLGAAATLDESEISAEDFQGVDLVHLEGYLLFQQGFFLKVVELAKAAGCLISLDLSSFEVVGIFKEQLQSLLPESIDIIIANEDEAKAYTEAPPEESLEVFAPMSEIAIVKLGAEGVLIAQGDERHRVSANKVEAKDTTGAGDLWASGFLHGLSKGWPLDRAARLGAITGGTVVQRIGAVIPDEQWEEILSQVESC